MRTCRYCNQSIEDISYHLNFNRICNREHSLWKRELQIIRRENELSRRELVISYLLNSDALQNENNLVVDEICVVFSNEEEESDISLLNKYSTDTIFKSSEDFSCPVCLEDIKERANFTILNNCGHHMCISCFDIINQQTNEKLCPVCRSPI